MPGGDFTAERFPDAGEMLLRGHARGDGSAARRKLVENGNVEVAIESERQRARDGRGGEHEDVRGVAGTDAIEGGGFFRGFQAADEELDAIAGFSENAAGGKKMLHGKDFGGRHESSLRAVFDGDDGGLEGDDGFAAADVALKETIHRGGLFEVGGDFGKNAFLRGGGLEGEDALEGFADGVFAEAEGDGVFLAGRLAVEGEAELVEEKFLEDEALLRGRAKGVQRVERFARFGEVRVDDGFGVRGKAEANAQGIGQDVGHALIDELDGGVHGAANLLGAEGADGFVDGDDAADFSGVEFLAAEDFDLRIDHFEARGAELVDFRFAVENELLAGFQAAFEIAAVKKFAGEQAAGVVLDEEMIDGVTTAAHAADGLAAHDAGANGVDAVGLDVFHFGKMDAVFVAEWQVAEEILKSVDAALRKEFGALRADAFDHADFGAEVHRHRYVRPQSGRRASSLYHSRREQTGRAKLARLACVPIE